MFEARGEMCEARCALREARGARRDVRFAEAQGWLQPYDLHVSSRAIYRHSCDARLQLEAPGTGGAGIHDEARTRAFDERLVGVAVHDDVGSVSRQQS